MMAATLEWNYQRQRYEAPYDETHTIYVDGDVLGEEVNERARTFLKEKHPDATKDEITEMLTETEEGDACYNQAEVELLDSGEWYDCAVEVDEDGEPLDQKQREFHWVAWIQENDRG